MIVRYEKACTGEFSVLHVEGVIRTEEEVLLIGKFENQIDEYKSEYPIVALGILQDIEDPEQFYTYETALVQFGYVNPESGEVEDLNVEPVDAKIKYYLEDEERILPWVSILRSYTRRYTSEVTPSGFRVCEVMKPSGRFSSPDAFCLPIDPDFKAMTYNKITDKVKRADL